MIWRCKSVDDAAQVLADAAIKYAQARVQQCVAAGNELAVEFVDGGPLTKASALRPGVVRLLEESGNAWD